MSLSKKDFDAQLKRDSRDNAFTVESNYIVFDKHSRLSYEVIAGYTLGELLTKNPVASYTKLSKDLLLRLAQITENLGSKVIIYASYRSPEYSLTVVNPCVDGKDKRGEALDFGFGDPVRLAKVVTELPGDFKAIFYKWGCHFALSDDVMIVDMSKDNSFKSKALDFVAPDKTRNLVIYGLLALVLFLLVKIF